MTWNPDRDYAGEELTKIWPLVVPYSRGHVLDLGAGPKRLFGHWITLDSGREHGERRVADIKADAFAGIPFQSGAFNAVVASHVIEHTAAWQAALAEWWRLVAIGGHLVLYWPHPDHYPRVGQPGANRDHKVDLMPSDIDEAMARIAGASTQGWDLLENETRAEGEEYSQFQVYRKRPDMRCVYEVFRFKPRDGQKSCLVVRFGGHGDHIMASSILPGLKAEGSLVVYMTTPRGRELMKADPHIDGFLVQDENQVPNEDLGPYVAAWSKRFDRVIDLNESIEGGLLALPWRVQYNYSDDARRRLMDVNYLERTHDIAGMSHDFRAAFHPTQAERDQVAKIRAGMSGLALLWVLRGSAVHKLWPWMGQAMVRLLWTHPDLNIVMAGDESCRELEKSLTEAVLSFHGKVDRLHRTCGEWPVRATMAMAQIADVVVGPETGVLNAVGLMPDVAKVVLLSHSSANNLTKHWANAHAIVPPADKVPCYPCHRMHTDFSACARHEATGTAMCNAMIPVETVVDAIGLRLADARARRPSQPLDLRAAD